MTHPSIHPPEQQPTNPPTPPDSHANLLAHPLAHSLTHSLRQGTFVTHPFNTTKDGTTTWRTGGPAAPGASTGSSFPGISVNTTSEAFAPEARSVLRRTKNDRNQPMTSASACHCARGCYQAGSMRAVLCLNCTATCCMPSKYEDTHHGGPQQTKQAHNRHNRHMTDT